MTRVALIALLSLSALATSASAQSIFSSHGFGVPLAPLDPRSQALGGIGVGILGYNPSLINPAELAVFPFRGAAAAMQSSSRDIELGSTGGGIDSNRFPLLRVVYPLSLRLTAGVGYGGFLDQSWAVEVPRHAWIGGDSVDIRDAINFEGGVAQLRVGLAYALTPGLSVGVDGGIYTGSLKEQFSREFASGAPEGVVPVERSTIWTQRAPLISAGIRWDPASLVRLSGSLTWAGTMKRTERSTGPRDEVLRTQQIQLPLQAAAGASAYLAPGVLATVATQWAGWSRAAGSFSAESAPADTWEYGAGLEFSRMTIGNAGIPIRFGYRHAQLPFSYQGVTPTEWTASFGFGLQLARTDYGPLATLDAAIDRGRRSADGTGLSESFWRITLGMGIYGR